MLIIKLVLRFTALVLVMAFLTASSMTAEKIKDKIEGLKKENERLDRLISEVESNIDEKNRLADLCYQKLLANEAQIEYYNNLVYQNEQDLKAKEGEAARVERELKDLEYRLFTANAEIESLKAENKRNLEVFGQVMAELYMGGMADISPFIQGSSDIYDLMIANEVMEAVNRETLSLMKNLSESLRKEEVLAAKLEEDIFVLSEKKTELSEITAELEAKRDELSIYLSESEAASRDYKNDYYKYKSAVSGLENQKSTYKQSKKINKAEADAFDRLLEKMLLDRQTDNEYIEGKWRWPLDPEFTKITTEFGYDPWREGTHNGVDISGEGINWSNIYAAKPGIVTVAEMSYTPGYSYGKFIVIDHGGGYISLYGHCNDIYVNVGQRVEIGDVIGAVGSTGWSTGPHLHFEIRINGEPKEPLSFIR